MSSSRNHFARETRAKAQPLYLRIAAYVLSSDEPTKKEVILEFGLKGNRQLAEIFADMKAKDQNLHYKVVQALKK